MRPYVVKQGDYLRRLAHERGFQPDVVWEHAANKDLRERRDNPEILAPGDILYVPAPDALAHPIEPASVNRYRAKRERAPVNLKLMNGTAPLANARCRVIGAAAAPIDASTDGDGMLSLEAPLHVPSLRLEFADAGLTFTVKLGHIDPITEVSGVRQRLTNLGFAGLDGDDFDDGWDDPRVIYSLKVFQREQGLDVTGEMSDATRDALRRLHGA